MQNTSKRLLLKDFHKEKQWITKNYPRRLTSKLIFLKATKNLKTKCSVSLAKKVAKLATPLALVYVYMFYCLDVRSICRNFFIFFTLKQRTSWTALPLNPLCLKTAYEVLPWTNQITSSPLLNYWPLEFPHVLSLV